MEEYLKNLDYQQLGGSVLELVVFLLVVVVVVAILDRWNPEKPQNHHTPQRPASPLPKNGGIAPEPDRTGEAQSLKDDLGPIPLEDYPPTSDDSKSDNANSH
jgi:hypothetical protein